MTVGPDPDGGEWRAPEPTEVIELPARGVGRRVIVRYAEENPWTADGAVFD
ncbi:hypothetical protein [Iamia sp.]|uniref:hypothetical protein n=1 Tax=Iamia sp. TaxID=2722710 RepID=UPI002C0D0071|nr:hypothetical protein [Iamia sp.]HXH56604.1 hypothetical protein [Iamia sp.]